MKPKMFPVTDILDSEEDVRHYPYIEVGRALNKILDLLSVDSYALLTLMIRPTPQEIYRHLEDDILQQT